MWPLDEEHAGSLFWGEILPRLKSLETQTWGEILVASKKQNHSIELYSLNPVAQKRLEDLKIEADAIISLRVTGSHRVYGFQVGSAFQILWFDSDHGDNANCVCRSALKYT